MQDTCLNCGKTVNVSIFRGDHVCGIDCLKVLTDDTLDRSIVHRLYDEQHSTKGTTPARRRAGRKGEKPKP